MGRFYFGLILKDIIFSNTYRLMNAYSCDQMRKNPNFLFIGKKNTTNAMKYRQNLDHQYLKK